MSDIIFYIIGLLAIIILILFIKKSLKQKKGECQSCPFASKCDKQDIKK